jgi:hypothetical protein
MGGKKRQAACSYSVFLVLPQGSGNVHRICTVRKFFYIAGEGDLTQSVATRKRDGFCVCWMIAAASGSR